MLDDVSISCQHLIDSIGKDKLQTANNGLRKLQLEYSWEKKRDMELDLDDSSVHSIWDMEDAPDDLSPGLSPFDDDDWCTDGNDDENDDFSGLNVDESSHDALDEIFGEILLESEDESPVHFHTSKHLPNHSLHALHEEIRPVGKRPLVVHDGGMVWYIFIPFALAHEFC
jgi:hypothetical protein